MSTRTLSKAEAAFKKETRAAEATQAWQEHLAEQTAVNANMMRLRAERLEREKTLPETQGAKEKPEKPGRKSKNQNAGDRP